MKKRTIKLLLILVLILTIVQTRLSASEYLDWNGVGGNSTNTKVSYSLLPTNKSDVSKVATVSCSGTIKSIEPLIINDKMYINCANKLTEYDLQGKATGRQVDAPTAFYSKIAYGDDKLFINSLGYIIAVDINTFLPIWKTKQENNAQSLSSITYHDGYIYTGYTINPSASGTPSDGFFFAVEVKDEDPTKEDEIKNYAWTYNINEPTTNGYYWADAVIANGAVIFAGDKGELVSHSLRYDFVYDKYTLNQNEATKKVRSTIVFDSKENYLYVATFDSNELFKIKMNNSIFDRNDIKSTKQIDKAIGGITLGKDHIYVSSGGMNGGGKFTIIKKSDLSLAYSKLRDTQSVPLITKGYKDAEYVYFLSYGGKSLYIMKNDYNSDPTSSTNLTEYSDSDFTNSNMGTVVTSDITGYLYLVSGKNLIILDNKNKNVDATYIQNLIDKTDNLTSIYDYNDFMNIKYIVDTFKTSNPNISINNESKLNNNFSTLQSKINTEIDYLKDSSLSGGYTTGANYFFKMINSNARYHNLALDNRITMNKIYYTSSTVPKKIIDILGGKSPGAYTITAVEYRNITNDLYNMVKNDLTKVITYQPIIEQLKNAINKLTSSSDKNIALNNLKIINAFAVEANNKTLFDNINTKINQLSANINLDNENEINTITSLLNSLSTNEKEAFELLYATNITKYENAKTSILNQRNDVNNIINKIKSYKLDTIVSSDLHALTSLMNDYNNLDPINQKYITNYSNLEDCFEMADYITVNPVPLYHIEAKTKSIDIHFDDIKNLTDEKIIELLDIKLIDNLTNKEVVQSKKTRALMPTLIIEHSLSSKIGIYNIKVKLQKDNRVLLNLAINVVDKKANSTNNNTISNISNSVVSSINISTLPKTGNDNYLILFLLIGLCLSGIYLTTKRN